MAQAAAKRGLGKGLGALIPSTPEAAQAQNADGTGFSPAIVPGAVYAELPVGNIEPNPRQPRSVFDPEALAELVYSIREIGLLQPVVVREVGNHYELIAGERRLRASKEAGLTHIPAIIRATDDDDLLRDALLENLHRANLNALEEAAAYSQLLTDFGCTQDELAKRIGRSRPQVSNTLRLLKLPPDVQRRVAAGVLSAGHARALLSLEDADAMNALAQRIVNEGLSVRNVEEIILLGQGKSKKQSNSKGNSRTDSLQDLVEDVQERLSDALDTRVTIAGLPRSKSRGTIVIEAADADDLRRITEAIAGPAQRL